MICPDCWGEGFEVVCWDDLCVGQGWWCVHSDGEEPCATCHGDRVKPCATCHGWGGVDGDDDEPLDFYDGLPEAAA